MSLGLENVLCTMMREEAGKLNFLSDDAMQNMQNIIDHLLFLSVT